MTHNKIVNGYYMNVVDDDIIKHEISYNEVSPEIIKYEINYNELSPEIKHYSVAFDETVTTSPTTYTDSDGTEYSWDNESVTLTEVKTEM